MQTGCLFTALYAGWSVKLSRVEKAKRFHGDADCGYAASLRDPPYEFRRSFLSLRVSGFF